MLDDFTPTIPEPKAASHPSPSPPASSDPLADLAPTGISDEDFASQLQAGMAELLGGLEKDPDMQAQLQNMFNELEGAAALANPGAPTSEPLSTSKSKSKSKAKSETATKGGNDFQAKVQATMERMNASNSTATAAASTSATASSEEDMLASLMSAMGSMDGEGSEEDFSKMLLGMMEQLTNKEILYEPMKELHDKFPDWLSKAEKEGKVPQEDMKRYREQQTYVKEIVGRFERKGYTDENVGDREYIVERMQKMQAAGSPPPDLVGSMEAAQEAFGAPEEGCAPQ